MLTIVKPFTFLLLMTTFDHAWGQFEGMLLFVFMERILNT